jgi:hypothetical protein
MARGKPSPQSSAGLWQDAHEIQFEPDSRGSKNKARPSSSRPGENALSAGYFAGPGRWYLAFIPASAEFVAPAAAAEGGSGIRLAARSPAVA